VVINLEDQEINCGDIASIVPEVSGGYGIYTYEWNTLEDYPDIDVAPAYPDGATYTLSVTDTCGFGPFTEEVVISYPDYPALEVNAGPDQLINCLGDLDIEPEISGGYPPYTYRWLDQYENELGTDQDLSWQPDEAGDVVIIVNDLCDIDNSDTVAFAFPPIPVDVDLGPDFDVTCLDINTLEGNVNGGVGQGGFTYEWSSNGSILGDEATLDVQVDEETSYTLTAEDQCGNIGNDEVTLFVPPIPVNVDLGPDMDVTCIDVSTLAPSTDGGVGEYSYEWTANNVDAGNSSSIDVTISDQTTYLVNVEDECGNINSDEITLSVPPVPIDVDLGPDLVVVCVDTTLLEADVSGGVGDYNYLWEEGYDSLSTSNNILFNTDVSTFVTLTIEDECENIGIDEIALNIPSEPIYLDVTADTTLCPGDSLILSASASGGQGGYTYLWMPSFTTDTIWNHTYYDSEVIEVYAQDVCGNNTTEAINVAVEEVHANFDFVYLDEWSIQTYNSSVPSNSYYFWDLGDGEFSAEFEPSHTYFSLDPYTITLSITTERGCVDTISRVFEALMDVYVPSAFSPNQDGLNDVFQVKGRNVSEFEMWIFNRWGEEIHHSTDIDDIWTGGFRSGDHYIQNDVYTYRIRAVGQRGRTLEKSGTITIIR
jgi:gliding motility-associated-like protein